MHPTYAQVLAVAIREDPGSPPLRSAHGKWFWTPHTAAFLQDLKLFVAQFGHKLTDTCNGSARMREALHKAGDNRITRRTPRL
jgi:hypothetical protein